MEPNWTILTNFGLPGLMLGALLFIAKAWIAKSERVEMERIKVEDKKADAFIATLNSLAAKIDAHHTLDIQSHSALGSAIAELRGQVTEAISWQERTPVEQPAPRAGTYGPQRPGSRG
jgi:hypothetical protein